MAVDEALAHRVRDHLAGTPGLTEKAMFGGLALLVGPQGLEGDRLGKWIDRGVAHAASLPAKR